MTSPTHLLVALAIGSSIAPRAQVRSYLLVGALCAVVPDLDLLAPYLGGGRDFHRRFTHSLSFAGLLGSACGMGWAILRGRRQQSVRLGGYAALSAVSHTVTDLLTTYPLGVAAMSPFSTARYVLPWRPIDSLTAEMLLVTLPAACVTAGLLAIRRIRLIRLTRQSPLTIPLR